jgi:two-component system, OmpR family, sensor histidine kinase RstB
MRHAILLTTHLALATTLVYSAWNSPTPWWAAIGLGAQTVILFLNQITHRQYTQKTLATEASLASAQRELTRAVSHELKTPVARLRLGLEMAQLAEDDAECQQRLLGMDKDIHELETLIDEILLYARLDHTQLRFNLRPCNLHQLADETRARIETLFPNKTWSITTTLPPTLNIEAEPRYLARLLQNLISNAARHARSRVEIHLGQDSQHYVLRVDDDGPGIPADQRDAIFQTFVRLDQSRARDTGGHGLGLAIAQRIAAGHHGQLRVETSPLGGARFIFSWPIANTR